MSKFLKANFLLTIIFAILIIGLAWGYFAWDEPAAGITSIILFVIWVVYAIWWIRDSKLWEDE